MSTNYGNYRAWYADLLPTLFKDTNAGFAILMVTFPLLERYLRQKGGLTPQDSLNDGCWNELRVLFAKLSDNQRASQFWTVYRNGILHQVTLSREKRNLSALPVGFIGHESPEAVEVDANGDFWVQPVLLCKRVLDAIERDFALFEGKATVGTPLPKVASFIASTSGSGVYSIYLGTGGRP
jgi:hypothetical protein